MHLVWMEASRPVLLAGLSAQLIRLRLPDVAIIVIYFLFVLGIGLYLKRYTSHGEDFFLAGRSVTAWVAGMSFVAFTRPRPVEELTGFVCARTPLPDEKTIPVYKRPVFWAGFSLAIFLLLQYVFW